jgi:Tfp pilus assembly protein PilO
MKPPVQRQWCQLGPRDQMIVALIVALAIVAAGVYLHDIQQTKLRNLESQMADLKNEIDGLKTALPLRQKEVEQAGVQHMPVTGRTSLAGQTEQELLQRGRLSSLIDDLMRLAKEDDIQIISIKPGEPVNHDGYVELPITMDVRARFRSLGEYLQQVQHLQQVVLVGRISVELSVVEQAGLTVQMETVSFLGKA